MLPVVLLSELWPCDEERPSGRVAQLRHDLALEDLGKRLACQRCKARRAKVIPDEITIGGNERP
jgi:hypothetical protein